MVENTNVLKRNIQNFFSFPISVETQGEPEHVC